MRSHAQNLKADQILKLQSYFDRTQGLESMYRFEHDFDFGWPRATFAEPLVIIREHEFQWVRPGIDQAELAKLRFEQGLSLKALVTHFECSESTVTRGLRPAQRARLPRAK